MNREPHLDNGFLIVKEDNRIASPISVIFSHEYVSKNDILEFVGLNKEKIQCVVAGEDINTFETIGFGHAQMPEIDDYADNIDTMGFLLSL
jgi:hypothetical protein